MMQIVEQTRDEKIAMYMKLSKKELVLSHIELEKYIEWIKENHQVIAESWISNVHTLRVTLINEYNKNHKKYCPICLSTNIQEIGLHDKCVECYNEWSILRDE
jgi:hypothetical protein